MPSDTQEFLRELNLFLGEASKSTYAGGMTGISENGYKVLAYKKRRLELSRQIYRMVSIVGHRNNFL